MAATQFQPYMTCLWGRPWIPWRLLKKAGWAAETLVESTQIWLEMTPPEADEASRRVEVPMQADWPVYSGRQASRPD